MDRRCFLNLQGGRQVSGVLRGFDMFLNLVVDQAHEELGGGQRIPCLRWGRKMGDGFEPSTKEEEGGHSSCGSSGGGLLKVHENI
uniref:Sm domain-containing protein n=1 Tax=Kwoniella bestiolae CBS 10118 TaxID=1296100 RepID=A0A1B9G418_9TREE|nr:hypothetical protein I302_03411 [Kwoniella bestiolae CBS 10118]OCF25738.1 hypothetical protein I302_03411 [Kwoniella bestiolae CBS 10118]